MPLQAKFGSGKRYTLYHKDAYRILAIGFPFQVPTNSKRVNWHTARDEKATEISIQDENGTEIFRTDRFRFLHYDIVFYIMKPFLNFVKHKKLSVSVGFTTIFILFCTL